MSKINRSKGARHHAKRVARKKRMNKNHNPRIRNKNKKK